MTNVQISVLCLIATIVIYFANKRLYRRFRALPLMPLVFTPILLVLMLVFGHISWQNYIGESHWLLWLLGPATIAFAVPVYENLAIIKRHWMSLSAGVVTATVVAVCSSVWLARLFTLSDEIQRSLAVRSVTTPFALAAAKPLGGAAGPGVSGRRAAGSGGAVCGRDRRLWHGGGRYALFAAFYSGGDGERGRVWRGVSWRRYGAFV